MSIRPWSRPSGFHSRRELQGTSSACPPRPEPRENPIYAETFFPRLHFGWSDLAALIVDRYHFIDAPQPELYDLLQDPDESDNLVGSEPALETELRMALRAYDRELEAPAAARPRDPAPTGGPGLRGRGDDDRRRGPAGPQDPGRRRWRRSERAYGLFADGDLESAVSAFQRLLKRTRESRMPGSTSPSPNSGWAGRTRLSRPTRRRSNRCRTRRDCP